MSSLSQNHIFTKSCNVLKLRDDDDDDDDDAERVGWVMVIGKLLI